MAEILETLRLAWLNLRLRLAESMARDELLFDALRRVYWTRPRKEKE